MSERVSERRIEDVIRIGKFTSSSKAGASIAHNIRNIVGIKGEGVLESEHFVKFGADKLFVVQASGKMAIYSAVKALATANAYLQSRDVRVGITPDLEALSGDITGMTFEVSLHKVSRK
ncbi:MAG TPA: hypothetical protein VLE44_01760 [Candidatus Saccharimonadales bacterium]|nr:hypothetical protein [Candidatus Saccharimonadales bacterium]